MKHRISATIAGAVMALGLSGGAMAGSLEDSRAAYQRGDYATALRLLQPMADLGDANAQYGLGVLYANGLGVSQNQTIAASWWLKAANQGHAKSQLMLGALYGGGLGVPQDRIQAYMWFSLAISRLPAEEAVTRNLAVKDRDLVGKLMTRPQITEAQQLAHAFSPSQGTDQAQPPPISPQERARPPASAEAGEKIGNWTFATIADPITDKIRALALDNSESGTIVVKCDSPGPYSVYMQFFANQYLGGDGGDYGHRTIVYRIDDGTPVSSTWIYKDNNAFYHSAANDPVIRAFIDGLLTAKKLTIRAVTYEFDNVDATFDVEGAAYAVAKVKEICAD